MTYGQQPGGPQFPGGYQPPQPMSPEDQRLWATLTHIGGIFFNFVAPLVAYLVLRDRGGFIREHTRVALNFHITMAIAYVAAGLLTIVLIGAVLLPVIGILTIVLIGAILIPVIGVVTIIFGIMAAVAANRGEFYRYPLSIEFVKP